MEQERAVEVAVLPYIPPFLAINSLQKQVRGTMVWLIRPKSMLFLFDIYSGRRKG